jgi:trehalose-phosphatase
LDTALAVLAETPRLLVCCDFDGTISAIADEPAAARPVDGAVAALDALAGLPDTWAAVVSGRALIDLTQLAGMPDRVHLVGSHGTEFEVGAILAVSPQEDQLIEMVVRQCEAIIEGMSGVLLERKPGSVAVHVRQASRPDAARVLTAVRAGPCRLPDVHVIEGKEVIELAVFAGNKANGLDALRARWDITATLFAGDDITDESAFAALGENDMGVKVGPGTSLALWQVSDPAAVVHLLERLADLRAHDENVPSGGGELRY